MVVVHRNNNRDGGRVVALNLTTIIGLLLLNLLCFQLGRNYEAMEETTMSSSLRSISIGGTTLLSPHDDDPLRPQPGSARALPSIRVQDDAADERRIYGGKGDGKHLGGWTDIDIHGISPFLWRHMMTDVGIKSIIDVGCGRGISTSWFIMNGMDALCVEGSHDAYENSVLPDKQNQMVEHDFSRGPYWPAKTYDAVWCVEFTEHVGRNFHKNYLPVFRKAAILFVTHSQWGGWHHVEVHKDDWWIRKFELYGFKYMHEMTLEVREVARQEAMKGPPAVNGQKPNPQNLYHLLVFFNPAVGALPQHAHLFAEPGCYHTNGTFVSKVCGDTRFNNAQDGQHAVESTLPPEFQPLPVLPENQRRWEEHIRKYIKV